MDIPNRDVFSETIESEYDVNCYTDGSKINEQVGAGIVVKSSPSKGGLRLKTLGLLVFSQTTLIFSFKPQARPLRLLFGN